MALVNLLVIKLIMEAIRTAFTATTYYSLDFNSFKINFFIVKINFNLYSLLKILLNQ